MPVTETVTDPEPKATEIVGGGGAGGGAWVCGWGAAEAGVTVAGAVGGEVGEAAGSGCAGAELGPSDTRLASTWPHPHRARRTAHPRVAGNLSTAFHLCITKEGNERRGGRHLCDRDRDASWCSALRWPRRGLGTLGELTHAPG